MQTQLLFISAINGLASSPYLSPHSQEKHASMRAMWMALSDAKQKGLESKDWELVVRHTDCEGLGFVMPAQAGIQGEQEPSSRYSAWILAFARMTPLLSLQQMQTDRLRDPFPPSRLTPHASRLNGFTLLEVLV